MPAKRINPPLKCAATIKRLASKGFELIGIAEEFHVHVDLLKEWMEKDERLSYAYIVGREIERQALHEIVFEAAKANRTANSNAKFLLVSKYSYSGDSDAPNNAKPIEAPQTNVLVIKDLGTDEQWAAKAAAQQRALTAPESNQIAPGGVDAAPDGLPSVCEVEAAPEVPPAPSWPRYAPPDWRSRA